MYLIVGRIVRPHGIRGEVIVDVRTDEPESRFTVGTTLATSASADAAPDERAWPDGSAGSGGTVPDGPVAGGAVGVGITRDAAASDGPVPHGPAPAGPVPDGPVPHGPAGPVPDGPVPHGSAVAGSVPAGPVPDGAAGRSSAEPGDGSPGEVRWTVPPELAIEAVRAHQGRLIVSFRDVHDRNLAEELRGVFLWMDATGFEPPADPDEFHDHQLVGLTAVTTAGETLGEVARIDHAPASDLLVLRRATGGTALVPFVREIVPEVDLAGGRVVIDPPGGLLDL